MLPVARVKRFVLLKSCRLADSDGQRSELTLAMAAETWLGSTGESEKFTELKICVLL